jgi:uncharacterized membrane protein
MLRTTATTCILVGLAVSGYLLLRCFQVLEDDSAHTFDVCQRVLGGTCDLALQSREWWFMGISLAGWGLVYYTALGALLTTGCILRDQFEAQSVAAAALLTVFGASLSICLAYFVVSGRAPFCPLCIVLHVVNLLLVPVTFRLSQRSSLPFRSAVGAALDFFRGTTDTASTGWWQILGFAFCGLIAIVVYQWVLLQTERREPVTRYQVDLDSAWEKYSQSPRREIPLGELDPRLGLPHAPLQLVVFSDFGCSGCREFSKYPQLLIEQFPQDLAIVFKHAPAVGNRKLSMAAQAAHEQGMFWEFHDALFASQAALSEPLVKETARELGLSLERFSSDRLGVRVREKVEADTALADRLGLDVTPAVFLNNRRIQEISFPLLTGLIARLRNDDIP